MFTDLRNKNNFYKFKSKALLEYIVENFFLIYLLELGTAVTGSYYLSQVNTPKKGERLLVMYFWLVIFVEVVGLYPVINYFTDSQAFPFVEGTLFERNYWWYNSYSLIKFLVFFYYFIWQLRSSRIRNFFSVLAIIFTLGGVINLLSSQVFFTANSAFTSVGGTLILVILIFIYYYETLKSDRILNFYRLPVFYFSVGILIWHLTITPLFIYSHYFTLKSPEFVELHTLILRIANIILYSLFILGWLIGTHYRTLKGDILFRKVPGK